MDLQYRESQSLSWAYKPRDIIIGKDIVMLNSINKTNEQLIVNLNCGRSKSVKYENEHRPDRIHGLRPK